jgi:DNA-directed RNA polymerase subunit M/transcription elongation factor TFIIS
MPSVDDTLDVYCPQCANDESVYVEKIVQSVEDATDAYHCRCGKCGWRFDVMDPERGPFVADAPSLDTA